MREPRGLGSSLSPSHRPTRAFFFPPSSLPRIQRSGGLNRLKMVWDWSVEAGDPEFDGHIPRSLIRQHILNPTWPRFCCQISFYEPGHNSYWAPG